MNFLNHPLAVHGMWAIVALIAVALIAAAVCALGGQPAVAVTILEGLGMLIFVGIVAAWFVAQAHS